MEYIFREVILPFIAGSSAGFSLGIGLWPVYSHPKNLIIQVASMVIAIVSIVALIIHNK